MLFNKGILLSGISIWCNKLVELSNLTNESEIFHFIQISNILNI